MNEIRTPITMMGSVYHLRSIFDTFYRFTEQIIICKNQFFSDGINRYLSVDIENVIQNSAGQYFCRMAVCDDVPVFHDDKVVRVLDCMIDVMQHHDNRLTRLFIE